MEHKRGDESFMKMQRTHKLWTFFLLLDFEDEYNGVLCNATGNMYEA